MTPSCAFVELFIADLERARVVIAEAVVWLEALQETE